MEKTCVFLCFHAYFKPKIQGHDCMLLCKLPIQRLDLMYASTNNSLIHIYNAKNAMKDYTVDGAS